MQLKRLWDTEGKKIVFAEWPSGHMCQVWTDETWDHLYIYDMAQWLVYNGTNPWEEFVRSNWEELTDQVVWFYDTNVPTELYSRDHGDKAYYQFVDYDGTVLKSWTVDEWETPVAPADPTRAATAQYTYTFAGWNPTVWPISKRTVYTATYTATVNEYTITWVDGDGNTLDTDTVAYGETPEYTWATPTKSSDSEYRYVWDEWWTPDVVAVTWNATYTATFTAIALIPVTSIGNFSKTNNADMVEFGTTSYTFDYLPANADSFTNIEASLREGTWYIWNVDYSIDYDNGTATVTVTDLGESGTTTYVTYEIDFKLNNVLIQGVKWDILKTFTATFNDDPTSPWSWTIAPNPVNGVPYWTVITESGNNIIFTNTKVWFSETVVATPDEWSVLSPLESYAETVTENRECDVYWDLAN